MNTPVSFPIAKMLKECGYDKPTLNLFFEDCEFKENVLIETTGMDYGSTFVVEFSELIENWNDNWLTKKNGDRCFGCKKSNGYFETFSAPTISDVVMWIYEKHGVWISVLQHSIKGEGIYFESVIGAMTYSGYNSPAEAYEAAIKKYCLEKII